MKKLSVRVLLALCAVSSPVFADHHENSNHEKPKGAHANQMSPQMMEAWKKATTMVDEHKMLEKYVGEWDATSSWWMNANSTPEVTKGSSEFKSIFGGRFIQQEFEGLSMGQKFQGLGIVGFDTIKGQFSTVWLDSMGTAMAVGHGVFEKTKNAIVDRGEFSCPMEKDGTKTYRAVWTLPENDTFTYEMFAPGEDGKEYRIMKIDYVKAD